MKIIMLNHTTRQVQFLSILLQLNIRHKKTFLFLEFFLTMKMKSGNLKLIDIFVLVQLFALASALITDEILEKKFEKFLKIIENKFGGKYLFSNRSCEAQMSSL